MRMVSFMTLVPAFHVEMQADLHSRTSKVDLLSTVVIADNYDISKVKSLFNILLVLGDATTDYYIRELSSLRDRAIFGQDIDSVVVLALYPAIESLAIGEQQEKTRSAHNKSPTLF